MRSTRPPDARPAAPRRPAPGLAHVFASTFRAGLAAIVAMVGVTAAMYAVVVVRYESRRTALASGDRAVRSAHQAMVDQETGLRAYLATGDGLFLEPYEKGRRALVTSNQTIVDRLGRDDRLSPLLVRMQVTERIWSEEWADAAASRVVTPADTAFMLRGKRLFDSYRAAESALLGQVAAARARTVRTEQALLVGGFAVQLIVCVLMATLGLRRYRRMRDAVVEPVHRMLAAMEHAAAGEVAEVLSLDLDGPAELCELGYGLVEMTAALAHERALSEQRADENVIQAGKLRQILELAREIAGSLSLRYVVQSVASSTRAVSGCDDALVWLLDDDGDELRAVPDTTASRAASVPAPCPLGEGLVGQAARDGRTVVATDPMTGTVAAVPLIVGARVVGVLALIAKDGTAPSAETVDVLETIAAHAAAAIEAARLHGRTKELTQVDALTRLPNRRRLDADLSLEVERSRRYGRPFGFVMLDVDHFKRCNDEHGHQTGDEVLQQVAATLAGEVRASDTVYRYGGEEFAVLLRDTPAVGAAELADRLRVAVAERVFGQARVRATISLGVAVGPDDGLDMAQLIGVADERLFAAKRGGRNCVMTRSERLVDSGRSQAAH